MSEALDKLKSSVSSLVSTTTTTLADVSAKLNAIASGEDDSTDLTDLASQIDGVTSQLQTLDNTVSQHSDPAPVAGEDPTTGTDSTGSAGGSVG